MKHIFVEGINQLSQVTPVRHTSSLSRVSLLLHSPDDSWNNYKVWETRKIYAINVQGTLQKLVYRVTTKDIKEAYLGPCHTSMMEVFCENS